MITFRQFAYWTNYSYKIYLLMRAHKHIKFLHESKCNCGFQIRINISYEKEFT